MNKQLKNLLITKEKVPPKVRKLDTIIVDVWDIMLMIVLVLNTLKSLCKHHGVILTLKKVLRQLLKMQGMIQMTF